MHPIPKRVTSFENLGDVVVFLHEAGKPDTKGNGTQSDSGFPREFTTLITTTSKIKAQVSITLARPGLYGRPYG